MLLILVLLPASVLTQIDYHKKPVEAEGVNITVGPFDEFTKAWGLSAERMIESAEEGARSGGCVINPSSNLAITISIKYITTRDDRYLFKIEAHGTESLISGPKSARWGNLYDRISIIKYVEAKNNDDTEILSIVNWVSDIVGFKLYHELRYGNYD